MLELSSVRAGYARRPVLEDVSLHARAGRVLAVLGPNGAGKSTLVRVALGLHPFTAGSVRVAGKPLPEWGRKELAKQVAWVPQRPGEAGDFTVLEQVLMGRAPHLSWLGLPSEKDVERAGAVLAELGLSDLAGRRMAALSGGEQRLVLLARALVQEPSVLVLDEPTAFLDLKHQMEALARVRVHARSGMAVLAVLHDVNLAAAFADDVLLLRGGRVLDSGDVSKVLSEDRLEELYGVSMGSAQAEAGMTFFYPRVQR